MDPNSLARLNEEQQKAYTETEEKILQWEKYKSDYTALKDRLKTLPDKITHDVMVPFGSLAFMPGKLVHTNEIMVLLGDNWFVERSAKQAAAIVDRRMKTVNKELADLLKQKSLLEPRLSFTDDLKKTAENKDVFEIREEFDPIKDKEWRVQHKINVQKHRKRMKETKSVGQVEDKGQGQPGLTNEELWMRLDELEQIEKEKREIERIPDIIDLDINNSSSGDSGDISDDEGGDDDDDEDDGVDFWGTEKTATSKIFFTHSKQDRQVELSEESDTKEDDKTKIEENNTFICSPADIYSRFTTDLKSPMKESQQKKSKIKAFTGTIVEKKPESPVLEPSQYEQPKRISKFKAQRQKQPNT